jgi:hypothetical protein
VTVDKEIPNEFIYDAKDPPELKKIKKERRRIRLYRQLEDIKVCIMPDKNLPAFDVLPNFIILEDDPKLSLI